MYGSLYATVLHAFGLGQGEPPRAYVELSLPGQPKLRTRVAPPSNDPIWNEPLRISVPLDHNGVCKEQLEVAVWGEGPPGRLLGTGIVPVKSLAYRTRTIGRLPLPSGVLHLQLFAEDFGLQPGTPTAVRQHRTAYPSDSPSTAFGHSWRPDGTVVSPAYAGPVSPVSPAGSYLTRTFDATRAFEPRGGSVVASGRAFTVELPPGVDVELDFDGSPTSSNLSLPSRDASPHGSLKTHTGQHRGTPLPAPPTTLHLGHIHQHELHTTPHLWGQRESPQTNSTSNPVDELRAEVGMLRDAFRHPSGPTPSPSRFEPRRGDGHERLVYLPPPAAVAPPSGTPPRRRAEPHNTPTPGHARVETAVQVYQSSLSGESIDEDLRVYHSANKPVTPTEGPLLKSPPPQLPASGPRREASPIRKGDEVPSSPKLQGRSPAETAQHPAPVRTLSNFHDLQRMEGELEKVQRELERARNEVRLHQQQQHELQRQQHERERVEKQQQQERHQQQLHQLQQQLQQQQVQEQQLQERLQQQFHQQQLQEQQLQEQRQQERHLEQLTVPEPTAAHDDPVTAAPQAAVEVNAAPPPSTPQTRTKVKGDDHTWKETPLKSDSSNTKGLPDTDAKEAPSSATRGSILERANEHLLYSDLTHTHFELQKVRGELFQAQKSLLLSEDEVAQANHRAKIQLQENSSLREEISRLHTDVQRLQGELRLMQAEVKTLRSENRSLQSDVEHKQQELSEAKVELVEVHLSLNQVKGSMERMQVGADSMASRRNAAEKELDELTTLLSEMTSRANLAEKEQTRLAHTVAKLSHELETSQLRAHGLEAEREQLGDQLATARQHAHALQDSLEEEARRGARALRTEKDKLQSLAKELDHCRQREAGLSHDMQQANDQLQAFQHQMNRRLSELNDFKLKYSNAEQQLQHMKHVNELEKQQLVESTASMQAAVNDARQSFQRSQETWEKEREGLNDKLGRAIEQEKATERMCTEQTQKVQHLQRELRELQGQLDVLGQEHTGAVGEAQSYKAKCAALERGLADALQEGQAKAAQAEEWKARYLGEAREKDAKFAEAKMLLNLVGTMQRQLTDELGVEARLVVGEMAHQQHQPQHHHAMHAVPVQGLPLQSHIPHSPVPKEKKEVIVLTSRVAELERMLQSLLEQSANASPSPTGDTEVEQAHNLSYLTPVKGMDGSRLLLGPSALLTKEASSREMLPLKEGTHYYHLPAQPHTQPRSKRLGHATPIDPSERSSRHVAERQAAPPKSEPYLDMSTIYDSLANLQRQLATKQNELSMKERSAVIPQVEDFHHPYVTQSLHAALALHSRDTPSPSFTTRRYSLPRDTHKTTPDGNAGGAGAASPTFSAISSPLPPPPDDSPCASDRLHSPPAVLNFDHSTTTPLSVSVSFSQDLADALKRVSAKEQGAKGSSEAAHARFSNTLPIRPVDYRPPTRSASNNTGAYAINAHLAAANAVSAVVSPRKREAVNRSGPSMMGAILAHPTPTSTPLGYSRRTPDRRPAIRGDPTYAAVSSD